MIVIEKISKDLVRKMYSQWLTVTEDKNTRNIINKHTKYGEFNFSAGNFIEQADDYQLAELYSAMKMDINKNK